MNECCTCRACSPAFVSQKSREIPSLLPFLSYIHTAHELYLCSAALHTTHVSTEELQPCVMVYITSAGFGLSPNKPAHLSASLLIPRCCLSPPSSPRGQLLCVHYYFNYSGSNSKTLSMCTGHPPTTMYSVDTVINVRKWNPV